SKEGVALINELTEEMKSSVEEWKEAVEPHQENIYQYLEEIETSIKELEEKMNDEPDESYSYASLTTIYESLHSRGRNTTFLFLLHKLTIFSYSALCFIHTFMYRIYYFLWRNILKHVKKNYKKKALY